MLVPQVLVIGRLCPLVILQHSAYTVRNPDSKSPQSLLSSSVHMFWIISRLAGFPGGDGGGGGWPGQPLREGIYAASSAANHLSEQRILAVWR